MKVMAPAGLNPTMKGEAPPVYTTLMYQYWDIAQLTLYMHMGKTRPAKKIEYCHGARAD